MSTTEWKFVPVESDENMATAFFGRVTVTSRGGLIGIRSALNAAIAAAPAPPSVESLLEDWTPSDQQAFAKFRDKHFPGEMSSYAIQSLGSAWKDGQANAAPAAEKICRNDGRCEYAIQSGAEVEGHCPNGKCAMPQPAAHLTIPGALEWDGDNGTHGADGESRDRGESACDDAKEACAEVERAGTPGDVIREMNDELVDLRAQLDDYKSKWLANCEALKLLGIHARHAEKLVKICREKLDVDSAGKGFIEALDGFIGALRRDDNTHGESGEAKPSCESCGGWGHIETEDSAHDCPECGPSVIEQAVEAGVMSAPGKCYKPHGGPKCGDPDCQNDDDSFSVPDCPDCACVQDGDCLCVPSKPSAKPAKPKTCIECDQPYCHGVCVERGDQDYDLDQAAKGGDQ